MLQNAMHAAKHEVPQCGINIHFKVLKFKYQVGNPVDIMHAELNAAGVTMPPTHGNCNYCPVVDGLFFMIRSPPLRQE